MQFRVKISFLNSIIYIFELWFEVYVGKIEKHQDFHRSVSISNFSTFIEALGPLCKLYNV